MGPTLPGWLLQGRGAANRAVQIPVPAAIEARRALANLALRQHLATDVLYAITDRLLVDVQPDEVHTGHEEPPWMSLNQPLLLSSALVHQIHLNSDLSIQTSDAPKGGATAFY